MALHVVYERVDKYDTVWCVELHQLGVLRILPRNTIATFAIYESLQALRHSLSKLLHIINDGLVPFIPPVWRRDVL